MQEKGNIWQYYNGGMGGKDEQTHGDGLIDFFD